MSRNVSYNCDVCGKKIQGATAKTAADTSAMIKLWAPGESRTGTPQRFDLCTEHYEAFVSFLETGTVGEEGANDLD